MTSFPLMLTLLTTGLNPATSQSVPGTPNPPTEIVSFMVSDDYAEIDWVETPGAGAYVIEIRKSVPEPVTVLKDRTVWTSFYFRVAADPDAAYEFRLASVEDRGQSNWTSWIPLNRKTTTPGK